MIKETVESILETGALEHVHNLIETYVADGKSELATLDRNIPTQTLMYLQESVS